MILYKILSVIYFLSLFHTKESWSLPPNYIISFEMVTEVVLSQYIVIGSSYYVNLLNK